MSLFPMEPPALNAEPVTLPSYQGFPQLLFDRNTETPLYRIGNLLYNAYDLTPSQLSLNQMNLDYIMNINPNSLSSNPLLVVTEYNNYYLFVTQDNDLYKLRPYGVELIASNTDLASAPLRSANTISVPNIDTYPIQALNLAHFNDEWYDRFVNLVNNQANLDQLDLSPVSVDMELTPPYQLPSAAYEARRSPPSPYVPPPPITNQLPRSRSPSLRRSPSPRRSPPLRRSPTRRSPPQELTRGAIFRRVPADFMQQSTLSRDSVESSLSSPRSDTFTQDSYKILLKQLYGLPVEMPDMLVSNGLPTPIISFEEAQRLLTSGQVYNFALDPFLQPWAGPPSGNNRIITLIKADGTTVLVKAQYNISTQQIYAPV